MTLFIEIIEVNVMKNNKNMYFLSSIILSTRSLDNVFFFDSDKPN